MLVLTGISLGSLLEILLNCNLASLYLENSRLVIPKVWPTGCIRMGEENANPCPLPPAESNLVAEPFR